MICFYIGYVLAEILLFKKCKVSIFVQYTCADPEGGGGGGAGGPDPVKNHKNIGFSSNTCVDSLKNHKATKQAFNVGPSSARLMAFRMRTDDGSSTKKPLSKLDPLWQNFLDPRMVYTYKLYMFSGHRINEMRFSAATLR